MPLHFLARAECPPSCPPRRETAPFSVRRFRILISAEIVNIFPFYRRRNVLRLQKRTSYCIIPQYDIN